ncbi:MAG: hypothetical protein L3J13_03005 [Devosiaceae bacterium]|nr:hypothetical protein [Devosiaceae bacterium]
MNLPVIFAYSAFSPLKLAQLVRADTRNILRDPTLLTVLAISALPAILFFFYAHWMDQTAKAAFGLENISTYAAPIFFILPSYLIGWVIGFLILEEKDEGSLLALSVTPVGKIGIITYRAALVFIVILLIGLVTAPIFFPDKGPVTRGVFSLFISLQAVMVTFILPALAKNKVQGLALTKAINIFTITPLLAIIASPFRYLAGIFPGFWIGEYLYLSPTPYLSSPLILLFGFSVHLLIIFAFYRLLLSRTE